MSVKGLDTPRSVKYLDALLPVNRHNPIRRESSDSAYSVIELMREVPEDAPCLEFLSSKSLPFYLNEYAWRYNRRHQAGGSMLGALLGEAGE